MNLDRAIHVYRSFWNGTGSHAIWVLRCDHCDDDMDYATHADALASAGRHAARHAEEQCPHCGDIPPIRWSEW